MKKVSLFFLVVSFLFSCKKKDDSIIPPVTTDTIFPMGLIYATPQELSKIRSVKELDTALIKTLERPFGDAEIILTGMPFSNMQLFGDCAAWAVGYGMLGYHYRILYKNPTLTLSPTFIYNQLNGGQDEGISYPAAFELVKDKGTCKWALMPGSTTSFTRQPSPEAVEDARDYTVSEYFKFDKDDFAQIKGYLRRKLPIVIGLDIDAAFQRSGYKTSSDYETEPDGNIVWRSTLSYKNIQGHAMVICGYSDKLSAFLAFNSWGPTWGKNGYMWIDYDVFQKVVAEAYLAFPRYVTTSTIQDGGLTDVKAEGNVRTYSLINLVSKGVCYSTDQEPTVEDINDKKIDAGGTEGIFSVSLKDLKANTKYYVRAYALGSIKNYYGNQQSFTTGQATIPTITTTLPASITATSAVTGGIIISDGGNDILDKGIKYSLDQNFGNSTSISAGNGNNTFLSSITGLTPEKKYYVKAYATNSAGTAYGNEVSFETLNGILSLNNTLWEGSSTGPAGTYPIYLKLNVGDDLTCSAGFSNGPGNYSAVTFHGVINASGTLITWTNDGEWKFDGPWSISGNSMTGTGTTCLLCTETSTLAFTLTKQ